jgi:hypothetical protein
MKNNQFSRKRKKNNGKIKINNERMNNYLMKSKQLYMMIKSIKIKRIGIRMQKRNKKEYRNRIMRILIMMTKKILKIIRKIKKTKKI